MKEKMKTIIIAFTIVVLTLFASAESTLGSVTHYTDRNSYLSAAGASATTTKSIDFSTKDDGSPITIPSSDVAFDPLILRGVQFAGSSSYGVRSYYNQLIYTAPFDTITATLPANSYAFGVDVGRSYGAAGTFTVTLSSGQSYLIPVVATDGAVFFGITSDQPLEWATFTFDTYEFFVLDDFTYSYTPQTLTWTPVNVAGASPAPRNDHRMVYDLFNSKIVMFGGQDQAGNFLNDIWEFDTVASTWTNVTPTTGPLPRPRSLFAMAYDPVRKKVVIYGGSCSDEFINVGIVGDTWEWDVQTKSWSEKTGASTLVYIGLLGSQAAFDPTLQQVVLFGGRPYWNWSTQLMFKWNGTDWIEMTPSVKPPGRFVHSMTTDTIRSKIVMFGGADPNTRQDLWEWDGTSWTEIAAPPPPIRRGEGMAFDSVRGLTVLFGGSLNYNDTWEWNGSGWIQHLTQTSPPPRETSMVFDGTRMFIFGGRRPDNSFVNDVWTLAPSDATAPTSSSSVSTGPNAAGWHNTYVDIVLSSVDNAGGSGVQTITYTASGAQSIVSTTVSGSAANLAITAEGITTITYFAEDNAGNIEAAKTLVIRIDKTAPTISVIAPTSGSYIYNQSVFVSYSCIDGVSSVASCVGTTPNGGLLDTSSIGVKTFFVNTADNAGNSTSTTVNYTVSYIVPTSRDECKDDGWQTLQRANGTLFNNQGDCVSYVNNGT